MMIKNTIRNLFLLLSLSGIEVYAQSNPKPAGAYINAGAGWTPLLGTATAGAIAYNPVPSALFVFNSTLGQWVPWDGSSSGGGPPSGACGGDLGGTFPNCTVVGSHITSGTAGFTGPVSITNTATSGSSLFINTNSLFGSAVAPVVLQGTAANGPAFGFTNTTYGTNNKTWDIYQNPTSFNFRTSDDANSASVTWLSAVRSGNAITGITSSSGSGTWAHTGSFTTTGNITAQGTVNSTANTSPASITNSGVALSASPTVADVVYYDSSRTTNNHIADALWLSGAYSLRFKSDDQASATPFFTASGGQASGITGITSNSGTGTWAHTGPFSATGTITTPSSIIAAAGGPNTPQNQGVSNVQMFTNTAGNQSNTVFNDPSRTANNRIAMLQFSGGTFGLGFTNDAWNSGIFGLSIAGGQASGVTGITSSSGTGAWTHTGPFTATGNVTAPSFIGNASSATNLPGGLLGSMPYQSAASTTAMLAGSTSSAIAVLTQQGNGTISAVPAWNAATGTGLVAFGTAPTLTNPVITGGSINNTPIGATTRSTVQATTVNATSTVVGTNIMANEVVVAFSATPAFTSGASQSQIMTLTANVTSWTMAAGVGGRGFTLVLCQNATGGFTVSGTPANVRGFGTIGTTASTCSSQHFTYSGNQTAWLADGAMVINE